MVIKLVLDIRKKLRITLAKLTGYHYTLNDSIKAAQFVKPRLSVMV